MYRRGDAGQCIPKRDGAVPAAVRIERKHAPAAANSIRSEST